MNCHPPAATKGRMACHPSDPVGSANCLLQPPAGAALQPPQGVYSLASLARMAPPPAQMERPCARFAGWFRWADVLRSLRSLRIAAYCRQGGKTPLPAHNPRTETYLCLRRETFLFLSTLRSLRSLRRVLLPPSF